MVPKWMTTPEMLTTLLLFLLGAAISLYASEIRLLLKRPFEKRKKRLLKRNSYYLTLLARLHENPYRLTLWAIWSITEFLSSVIVILGGVFLFSVLVEIMIHHRWEMPRLENIVMPLVGGMAGRIIAMHRVVKWLYSYDSKTKELQSSIERLKSS
jgi:hypothetical protein